MKQSSLMSFWKEKVKFSFVCHYYVVRINVIVFSPIKRVFTRVIFVCSVVTRKYYLYFHYYDITNEIMVTSLFFLHPLN